MGKDVLKYLAAAAVVCVAFWLAFVVAFFVTSWTFRFLHFIGLP